MKKVHNLEYIYSGSDTKTANRSNSSSSSSSSATAGLASSLTSSTSKLSSSIRMSREFHENLSNTMSDYSEKCRIPNERENMINFVCEKLTKVLRQYPQYDDVIIKPFGSSVNGFGTPTSDLDLCIVTSSKSLNKDEKKERIEKLAEVLKKEGYLNINDSKKYIIHIYIYIYSLLFFILLFV